MKKTWLTTPVVFWVLLVGLSGYFSITTTRIETELTLLFPEGHTAKQQFLLEALREGPSSRLILMGLEGAPIDSLTAVSNSLAAKMRNLGDFISVNNGDMTDKTDKKDWETLLFENRYLLSPNIEHDRFSVGRLHQELVNRLRDLTSPISSWIKVKLPSDPTNEYWTVLQTWVNNPSPKLHKGVWVAPDGSRALLMAETSAAGFDLEQQRDIQNKIHRVFRETLPESPDFSSVRLLLTGPSVFAVETERTVKAESTWLSIAAFTLVSAFLFVNFRSLTPIALSLIPLISGCIAAILAVNFTFGFIHGITLAFGATLIGVVVDYPIHVFAHADTGDQIESSVKRIWPTMFLGAGTTALGYCALWLSGFPGLAQLGLFAITGILVAALVTRWILPHFVPQKFSTEPLLVFPVQFVKLLKRSRILFPIVLFTSAIYLGLSTEPIWETDIANLTPISAKKKQLDRGLRQAMGAPSVRDLLVIEGTGEQDVLLRSEEITSDLDDLLKMDIFGGYDIVTDYLPSQKVQISRQTQLPDTDTLRSNLKASLIGLPFKKTLFDSFVNNVARARTQNLLTSEDFHETPYGLKLQTLLLTHHEKWISVIPLQQVNDREEIRHWIETLNDPKVWYLDLKEESNSIMAAYRQEALTLLGWGLLMICIVLALRIRTLWLFPSVLLPIAATLLTTVALLHLLGERLSLFHLASFLLVFGLGLDYALFFNRPVKSLAERRRTISSIWICCTTTILVFGMLVASEIPVLQAIGLTAALGSFMSFVLSAMLSRNEVLPT